MGAGLLMVGLVLAVRSSFEAFALMAICGGSVVAVAAGGLLVIAATARPGTTAAVVLGSTFLRTLGKYSYALYLFHNPIQAVIRDKIYGPDQFFRLGGSAVPGQLLFYVLATVPTLGCAWLSWRFFEGPILRWKRFFPAGPEATGLSPVAGVAASQPGRRLPDTTEPAPRDAEVALG